GYRLGGDIGGPMNVGEEYRWNIPFITYGFDDSFVTYFGSNGVAAVDQAIATFNDLPPMSAINLDNYPFDSTRVNFQADTLRLLDVKSTVLSVLMEEMGLAEPERYVWTLRSRTVTANNTNWFVIQRNFDPVTYQPTPYINGKLYIYDAITQLVNPDVDFPHVITADPLAYPFISTVAGGRRQSGSFYTSLTYDDVGGLRYLLRPDNLNVENLLPDIREVFTDPTPQQLTTQDYCLLLERSRGTTNDPATLLAFPGYANLLITSTNSYFTNITTTNYTAFFTNFNFANRLIVETNISTVSVPAFDYTFGNVVIYTPSSQRLVTNITTTIGLRSIKSPTSGPLVTNVFTNVFLTNMPCGQFYIVPTNQLSFIDVTPLLTNTVATTNFSFTPTAQFLVQEDQSLLQLLITTDLATFREDGRTNDPAAMLTLYPDLLILQTNRYFTNVVATNTIFYFTNHPYDPPDTFTFASAQTVTTNVETNYNYVVGNVVTNAFSTNSVVTIQTVTAVQDPYAPPGSFPRQETNSITILSNFISGSIYIVPTNLAGYDIIATQLVEVVAITNRLDSGTNFIDFGTNGGGTNLFFPQNFEFTQIIRYATNYFFDVFPIVNLNPADFATNSFGRFVRSQSSFLTTVLRFRSVILRPPAFNTGLRGGVDKLTFVRVERDDFAGTNSFTVFTNQFTDTVIISNTPVQQIVRRT
ncbi:MAG: hypothetical protein ACR2H1_06740, partial [Limisphaerales bacterium]